MAKTYVLIPAYNEEKVIAGLVEQTLPFIDKVIVIDDGSTDKTFVRAEEKGAVCLRHSKNKGKGAALTTGFEYILGKTDAAAVIIMDGDGQHDPREIPVFLKLFETGQGDIIMGNRMLKPEGMPFIRRLTNKVMSAIISFLTRQNIPDSQCGYRLISRVVLEQVKCGSANYDMDSEILIKAGRSGFKIASVPVKSIYSGQASKINPWIDTIRFLKLLYNLKRAR